MLTGGTTSGTSVQLPGDRHDDRCGHHGKRAHAFARTPAQVLHIVAGDRHGWCDGRSVLREWREPGSPHRVWLAS